MERLIQTVRGRGGLAGMGEMGEGGGEEGEKGTCDWREEDGEEGEEEVAAGGHSWMWLGGGGVVDGAWRG